MNTTEYQREYQRARYVRFKAMGLCPLCGAPAETGRTVCSACTEYSRARRVMRIKSGVCTVCGGEVDYYATCDRCRELKREARKRRLSI